MKKIITTSLAILLINFSFGQETESFAIKGPVKLLGSWINGGKETAFSSTALDKFRIYQGQQGMQLTVSYKNNSEMLAQVDESQGEKGRAIKVCEFDFDNDKDPEYIVITAYSPSNIEVKVYKISKGLVKLIGTFQPQHDIIVSKNFISFPFGGQGQTNEYYFRDDAFYELVYRDPKRK